MMWKRVDELKHDRWLALRPENIGSIAETDEESLPEGNTDWYVFTPVCMKETRAPWTAALNRDLSQLWPQA